MSDADARSSFDWACWAERDVLAARVTELETGLRRARNDILVLRDADEGMRPDVAQVALDSIAAAFAGSSPDSTGQGES